MNFRMAQPASLVDLNGVKELFYIKIEQDGGVHIGAMTRDTTVEFNPDLIKLFPVLGESLYYLAHPQIRNRGTFGGATAHSDPAGQVPVVLSALDAEMTLNKKGSSRKVKADDFFVTLFTTSLEPDEILTDVYLPALKARSGASYFQYARQAGASALVGCAARVELGADDKIQDVRLSFMGVADRPVLSLEVQKILSGNKPTGEMIHAAVEACVNNELDPGQDMHATPEYRRHIAGILGVDAINAAMQRAKGT
jgi:CO/xanthine dehydrogenase FAD-binding subunit